MAYLCLKILKSYKKLSLNFIISIQRKIILKCGHLSSETDFFIDLIPHFLDITVVSISFQFDGRFLKIFKFKNVNKESILGDVNIKSCNEIISLFRHSSFYESSLSDEQGLYSFIGLQRSEFNFYSLIKQSGLSFSGSRAMPKLFAFQLGLNKQFRYLK